MDFSVINRAGIEKTEFAKVMKTSRTTVHSWLKGGGIHAMIRTRLAKTLLLIGKGVEAGDLPLPRDIPRAERVPAILRVIKKHNNPEAVG